MLTVFYDADCGLCKAGLALLLRWDRDRRLRPVSLETEEARRALSSFTREERMATWHVVDEAGRVHSSGAAAPVVLAVLPGAGWIARESARRPRATERIYRWVTDHRSEIGPLLPGRLVARAENVITRRSPRPAEPGPAPCEARAPGA